MQQYNTNIENKKKINKTFTINYGYNKDDNLNFNNIWVKINSNNNQEDDINCCRKILIKLFPCIYKK